jgi:hypothetical protein
MDFTQFNNEQWQNNCSECCEYCKQRHGMYYDVDKHAKAHNSPWTINNNRSCEGHRCEYCTYMTYRELQFDSTKHSEIDTSNMKRQKALPNK